MSPKALRLVGGALLVLASSSLAAGPDQRLVEAVKNRDGATVRSLLKQRVDVNVPQPDGATPLHWAVHWDDVATADLLIRSGARTDARNDYGVTPWELACTDGGAAMIRRLMDAGANPNAVFSTGETPLMWASRAGSVETVKALLTRGADVNGSESVDGQTAMMWAAAENQVDVLKTLIEAGGNVSARSVKADRPKATGQYYDKRLQPAGGFTPLLFAATEGHAEAVRLLLDAGANINEPGGDGVTALVAAAVRGHVDLAIFLLDHGADANADSAGYTALHWAAGVWESTLTGGAIGVEAQPRNAAWRAMGGLEGEEKLRLVKALLAHGANPNARLSDDPPRFGYSLCLNQLPLKGASPFLLAAMASDVPVMRALLAAGSDSRIGTANQTTPLMAAAGAFWCEGESRATEQEALEAITFTLGVTHDVNVANQDGHTALYEAADNGWSQAVQFLAEQGADVNVKDKRGMSAVETALRVFSGFGKPPYPETAALLHKLGAK